ncbi:ribonuclease P protein component [Propionivibrio soli]|uniref:ribonuclease P protein component n=1 Tax=Propionivibrio soli TaxID=2976531 RepID=UPI0021E73DCA|nr:ribonuclease P protein component [Propionivibrio soli]
MNASKPSEGGQTHRSAAFQKCYRLTKTDDFSSVFGFRRAIKGRYFLLHYRIQETSEAVGARLGLVVGKRLLRRSVDRNLIKRLAREQFRAIRCILPPRDIVLRLAAKPESLDKRALADEIRRLLSKMVQPGR